ncbi:3-hydroxy-3-methylglutaryl-coenzyme A reductase [Lactobacillus apis]|uniref:hydroxymethylglutaryl-CoA reductase, degradative n=1 Tax=Lactobacillus apis TaxID=303541 RepID=UPI0008159BA9|nr:hydroxymethylglutaryl-CoA reductase, degradative [Lactobacillus apis]GGG34950.1 hydroxymethylglutaryl-CoA reductase [Lactobacillus apis]SCB83828.1 3-hydroxy-3-methylglutaryl-coenzyme A reductase [Lactobacillus apis]
MKFYELTPEKRREYLINQGIELDDIDEITLHELDNLSENVIGQLRFPVGIVQNLLVNGKSHFVPLATEEPSVVAAANHGASIFAKNGGVKAKSKRTGIYGQITLEVDAKFDASKLSQLFPMIIEQANSQFASLVKHGGGVRQINLQQKDDLVMLRVLVDPAESMGANRVNSILEFIANKLATFPGVVDKLFAILSNYPSQFTTAQVELGVATVGGVKVAERIALLSKIGQNDSFRAVTNNKGIMNGVDAVLLATGNDARAVEAACGVWANEKGKYSSLSQWNVKDDKLIGSLTIPLAIGTVGGSINSRTDVKQSYRLLGQGITSSELANVIAAVGLANNLAALLAISTTGIQAGHMKLQAKNTVANLTATLREKKQVRQMMIDKKEYSLAAAEQFLKQIREGQ